MPPQALSDADYRLLGLKPGARPTEIKRAYRRLAKKWHPDRYHSESYETRAFAEKQFREINEAYERLLDNWWRSVETVLNARPSPAAAGGAERTHDRQPPPRPGSGGVDRRMFAYRAAGFLFLAAVLAVLVFESQTSYRFSPREVEVIAPPREIAPGPPDTAGRPPQTEAPLDELLSEIAPPQRPLLQPQADNVKNFFTVGSSSSEVLHIQGRPTRVQGQTWVYGLSEIHFKQGRVWRFNNFDGTLRVRMLAGGSGEKAAPPFFTVGSTEDDVLLVQGTPTRIEQDKWFYGFAEIRFKDRRVREFDNYFGALKVRLLPSPAAGFSPQKYFFTIGSTPDEVLTVQGTPTSIQGNIWSYNFSYVFFRDGRVVNVTDSDSNLRFIPPEDIPNSSVGAAATNSGS
ncbi:MAG: J domain-containing protein [Syntrophobacteraceae bacterium]